MLALVGLFPLWWLLGLGLFAPILFAVPMAVALWRRRPIKLPPGSWLWLLFLLWVVASALMLGLDPPGTLPGATLGRLPGFAVHLVQFLAGTVILLYVGNLTERELPRQRLVRLLGLFFVYAVAGGLLGVLAPTLQLTSPFALILPGGSGGGTSLASRVTHPAVAQVMDVLGFASPRPAAPFPYTNTWGQNTSLLLVWFVVGYWTRRRSPSKVFAAVVIAAAMVPTIYSLNRGMWIGLGLMAVYLAVRLALRGRFLTLGIVVAATALTAVAVGATPLQTLVTARLQHGHSNAARTFTAKQTLTVALNSPVLGFGTTRDTAGSGQSIAVGESAACPRCGAQVGANGEFWRILISRGYVGLLLYISFFVAIIWRYRRDNSPIGMAGVLVVLLVLFYMFFYNAASSSLAIYAMSIGLLWRNGMIERDPKHTKTMVPV